ncbi:MAG: ABC transporter permease, partial [Proteobacteria bacterium]|nr:ABC transporter permease [Pseudomonadota bacterium]
METLTTALNLILDLNADLWRIIGLSLRVSLSATLIAATLAIPIAALISHYNFYGRRLILLLSSTMMALPPVVVGLAVYLFLSRAGPLGDWGLLFTPQAMIIAQTILIFPII